MTAKERAGYRNQRAGHKFEMLVWNKINHGCCLDRAISSGSKGRFDVWSLQWDKLRLAICKTNGYLTPKERIWYAGFMRKKPRWVQVEFWSYVNKRRHRKEICKNAKFFENW